MKEYQEIQKQLLWQAVIRDLLEEGWGPRRAPQSWNADGYGFGKLPGRFEMV